MMIRFDHWLIGWAARMTTAGLLLAISGGAAFGQGSRKDDIVFGPSGHPVAGAIVTVCQSTATGTPCTPLATVYTDATLTVPSPNPFQTDGIGNYHFYAPAGRYLLQISGPGIQGTITYPDVILPADVSSSGAGNNLSAFGLTLGGDLSVAGNATVTGTLTTTNFNPGSFSPSTLNVGGNESVVGPRPRVDVTAFGAKGDSVTDDTAAIQSAINAACAGGGDIFFPAGRYVVSQPQTPSTSAVFTINGGTGGGCYGGVGTNPHLHFVGAGSIQANAQFAMAPMTTILVNAGASPNGAPVFYINGGTVGINGITFENLNIAGYNQAVSVFNATQINFVNDCLTSTGTTGDADNTPLKITNTFWLWFKGGCLINNGSSTNPVVELTGETQVGGQAPLDGLIYFQDMIWAGGGGQYIQRVVNPNSSGYFVFRNILLEDSSVPFFTITANSPGYLPSQYSYVFDSIGSSDGAGNVPFLTVNTPGGVIHGIELHHVATGQSTGPAIQVLAGGVDNVLVTGCQGGCNHGVVDGAGNPVGGATLENSAGWDSTVNTNDNGDRLRTDYYSVDSAGPALRTGEAGGAYATVGIDPAQGLLFGSPTFPGYDAQVNRTAELALDIGFATAIAPSGVAGTPTTGGTLAAGTYYYSLSATTTALSCNTGSVGALAPFSSAVVVAGSNNAVTLTWTPGTSGTKAIAGYCLVRSPLALLPLGYQLPAEYVAGASTTTYTDTGFTGCCYTQSAAPPANVMASVHRFTPTSLGIDTTSPQYNLDVNGSAAVNSLNGVEKAERFAGSDAGTQINNCLTAAHTISGSANAASGVCDARGLVGVLTATHHISIPVGTTLLWGQAQLTINDSTTNDAVEFAGDGAQLIGVNESGLGTVPRPQTSGYIACGIAGCTTARNANAATANIDWVTIEHMALQADGAASVVLNMTSIGHADVENNRFELGTGGTSYGIYGNTSIGDLDSTNSLVKHNEFDLESANDVGVYIAGVFNSIKFEQNSVYLPASNTGTQGFEIAKDSNGNYPDNDEFDANDCEAATTSFGQICFNLVGAQNVQVGPTNRCENVYNCVQFPSDGSAVGNHMIDPYLSLSVNTMVKPNEPAAAQQAMDNSGTNWQPSFHYGMNDLGGANLLTNAGFEGWSNTTTLFAWGGVSGSNINQGGSGIYAQQSSASAPIDSTSQGNYNVRVGDNATAGLGINSGCVPVDSTMNYTLALRIASTSTSVKFRPGFRFYSDPNCTEADRITTVATNARVLQPEYYGGQSSLAGTGANWQSTNASLTYNNGITCNCNVTGSDWTVATANTWTPTRNFAITFRVPNAYTSSATIAQSMRVLVLENSAANPNQIYVDDVALSQGPVSTRVPQTAPVVENGACVGCGINTLSTFALGTATAGEGPGAANQVDLSVIYMPNVTFSHITVDVSTVDSSTSDFYSWAITDLAGNVKCSMSAAVNLTVAGAIQQACSQGAVTLANGSYIFAFTGNATTAHIAYSGTAPLALSSAVSASSSTAGVMTFPITLPIAGQSFSSYGLPAIILN
ncbi:MAG: glycosyl hydrolase family 28-related protein [Candidatus Acidiferrales bacterium]